MIFIITSIDVDIYGDIIDSGGRAQGILINEQKTQLSKLNSLNK